MKEILDSSKLWQVKSRTDEASVLSKSLGISPILAQLLFDRGIKTHEEGKFCLEGRLKDLSDPFLFLGMKKAVERIFQAIEHQEKILVHGDYDVDGITGTALLCNLFSKIGINAQPYIPDRVTEGYGISREAIAKCVRENVRILITVDCGGSAFDEIGEATSKGLDVIVVDHHELKTTLPNCLAVIHPRLASDNESFKFLCAAGVAFKFAHGILKEGLKQGALWAKKIDLKDYLDRVAIATVADLVPLKGENKIIVKRGLERLSKTTCLGLAALLKEIGIQNRSWTTVDIGFRIAPRLNAAGRVGTAYDAIRLLLTQDSGEAQALAQNLDVSNRKRQTIEQQTVEEAIQILEENSEFNEDWVLVLHKDQWPLGVIGIVASRILRLRYRPTFIISADGDLSKGSARSIRGFHLCEALKQCEDLLTGYGGHAYAAGIKIEKDKISLFRERINQYAKKILTAENLIPRWEIDFELSASDISLDLAEQLEMLSPFGQENPVPLFMTQGLVLDKPCQLVGKDHLKLWIRQKRGTPLEGIAFGMAQWASKISQNTPFHAVYEIGINEYGGQRKVQLVIKDIKI